MLLAGYVGTISFLPLAAGAQSTTNLAALRGLLPFSELLNTAGGRSALDANYKVTSAIANGTAHQPLLEPFAAEREQALEDAFITGGNALQLADALGPDLDRAYGTLATCASPDRGVTSSCTVSVGSVAALIGYTASLSGADSNSAKFFFADATASTKTGTTAVSAPAAALLTNSGGTTDVYGKAYHHPAGSDGADPAGDSRPFQTEPSPPTYSGTNYFGDATTNEAYLTGPLQDLTASPAFPSGHTTYGYTESLLLAIMVPERYAQMVARAAEYGNDRIIVGAHYAMDVIGGRTLATYDVAQLLASNPTYSGLKFGPFSITDYDAALVAARNDLRAALATSCGTTVGLCAKDDSSRLSNAAADEKFYESTQTYGLPVVFAATAGAVEDIGTTAPEAGHLLTAAFPSLTLERADRILTETEGPGGGFLDDGSSFGVYSRLDLYKAALRAEKLAPAY
jgi:membrane-associated phospholipid phosphatase